MKSRYEFLNRTIFGYFGDVQCVKTPNGTIFKKLIEKLAYSFLEHSNWIT